MMLDWFKRKTFKEDVPKSLPAQDTAWADTSAIYTQRDFVKYNPDDLIGRKGYAIYRKMMMDEQIKAVVKFKRDAVTSRSHYFEANIDKLGEDEAKRRIAVMEAVIANYRGNFKDALNGIMSATYNGFSITEKIYGTFDFDGQTWWGIEALKLKPYDTFYFKTDEFGNITGFVQKVEGRELDLDLNKFIYYLVNPDADEHYGQSELRECYRAWFSKDMAIKFRNIWLERHAGGLKWFQVQDGKALTAPERTDLQAIIQNIQTSTGMIVPDKVKLESDYPANNVAFKEAIEDYNLDIARALLVPNLVGITPSGQTGSYSQSTTQLEAFLWTLEADASRLEDTLNEQLFREIGRANFGDDDWPRFRFKPIDTGKKLEIVKTWKDLVSAGAVMHTQTDEDHLRDLLDFPDAGDPIEAPQPAQMQPQDGQQADGQHQDGQSNPQQDNGDNGQQQPPDETVMGAGVVTVSSFTSAVKRVDFAVIGKTSEDRVTDHTQAIAKVMGRLYDDFLSRLDSYDAETIQGLEYNSKLVSKLRRTVNKALQDGWRLGEKHAGTEIGKAKGKSFTADKGRLDFISEDYFKLKSFKMTGDLTDATLSIIKNDILNGIKGEKSVPDTIKTIYSDLASAGYLSEDDAKEALGQALNVENPDARLNTVVRTNMFEAINEARYSYFTDPGLGGFVEALEYAAILDSRTTQICQHLDGHVHAVDSDVWQQYRPPNHYNCRSLLIPVTKRDTWSEDDPPSIEPQKGFA